MWFIKKIKFCCLSWTIDDAITLLDKCAILISGYRTDGGFHVFSVGEDVSLFQFENCDGLRSEGIIIEFEYLIFHRGGCTKC